jgi:hypothetical protein
MSDQKWVGKWISAEEHRELMNALRALRKRMPSHRPFIDLQIAMLENANEKPLQRGMKVSIDGLRKNLMIAYNEVVHGFRGMDGAISSAEWQARNQLKDGIDDLRTLIGGFLCMFSDNTDDLCSDMSEHCDKLLFADPEDADEDEEGK